MIEMACYELGERHIQVSSIALTGFLEISGECRPLVTPEEQYIEGVKEEKTNPDLSVYNYWWTLGITGEMANWINGFQEVWRSSFIGIIYKRRKKKTPARYYWKQGFVFNPAKATCVTGFLP